MNETVSYVLAAALYKGCPVHDGTSGAYAFFFPDLEALKIFLSENRNDYEFGTIYNPQGIEVGSAVNETGRHSCVGVKLLVGKLVQRYDRESKVWSDVPA